MRRIGRRAGRVEMGSNPRRRSSYPRPQRNIHRPREDCPRAPSLPRAPGHLRPRARANSPPVSATGGERRALTATAAAGAAVSDDVDRVVVGALPHEIEDSDHVVTDRRGVRVDQPKAFRQAGLRQPPSALLARPQWSTASIPALRQIRVARVLEASLERRRLRSQAGPGGDFTRRVADRNGVRWSAMKPVTRMCALPAFPG